MSQIKINVNDVRAENKAFKRLIGRIDDRREELSSLRYRIDGRITSRRNIDSSLNQASLKLNDLHNRLQALYNFIEYGMEAYVQADDKARDHPFERKKKKSIWGKIGGAINSVVDGVTGFVEGLADAVIGTVEGIYTMIVHPIQTIQGIVYVATHPVEVAVGVWNAVSESWNNDVVNGDAQSRGKWFGRMIGEVALAAVVTKGVDKVGKLAKGSKIIQEAGGVRVLPEVMKGRILGKEKNIKPPSIDKPDEIIKQRVHENVDKSKAARKSSNFDEYLTKEKELLKEVEKKRDLKGTSEVDTPSAFKQTEFASSYEARLNQTPSPNNKTVGFEGQRGESKCILKPPPDSELKNILDEAGIDGINYKNGVPDFSPVAKAELEIDHMVGGVGSNGTKARTANFKQADIKLAEQLNKSPELASKFGLTQGKIKAGDIADIREELMLTWHELNDGKTIQLVPSEINSKFGHLGGVGEINAGAFEPGGFAGK